MSEQINVSNAISGTSTDRKMGLETGRLAPSAGGSVVGRLGKTEVLVTATASESLRPGVDFFPLTVDIEERMYAAGKIPGSFFRREGRASESAILVCRLIDRPLRPCFPDGFRNDVHVVGIVMGVDQENPYDVLAINAASAALCISGIPFNGPVGAVRLAYTTEGEWIPHPTWQECEEATFEMVVAGRALEDGDVAVMMVEAAGAEGAWSRYADGAPKVDETVLSEGLEASKQWITEAVGLQRRLIAMAGVSPRMHYELQSDYSEEIMEATSEVGKDLLVQALSITDRAARQAAERSASEQIIETLAERFEDEPNAPARISSAIRSLSKSIVRSRILEEGLRVDGRGPSDLRPLSADIGVVAMAHGSGLFQRGETQVLNVATLGTQRMDQIVDGISPQDRKRYLHHYNFPPFSTGEAGFMRGPRRREIGHGALAERALFPVVPSIEEFPYAIRLVSDVLSSNGSTSMASVCASTLSLMDAGVPIKEPVGGIAMGLVNEGDRYVTLTDIQGSEDAFGDMDFKVAGTESFVTALQLDTKIQGIPAGVLADALDQAREARQKILAVMHSSIDEPRSDVSAHAPKISVTEIPLDKIGEVIGPKGKVINALQDEFGVEITVDEDPTHGRVTISAPNRVAVDAALKAVGQIVDPPTAKVGVVYTGSVVNITGFGAFVNILPGRDGLLHISKIGRGKRLERVEEVLSIGDVLTVQVDQIDDNDRISLRLASEDDPPDGASGAPASGAPAPGGGGEKTPSSAPPRRRSGDDSRKPRRSNAERERSGGRRSKVRQVSFAEEFDRQVASEFGYLGPSAPPAGEPQNPRGR